MTLCSIKVPTVQHSSITNLVVFHRFLEQNETYRAIIKGRSWEHREGDGDVVAENALSMVGDWENVGPLSEVDLVTGVEVKERLVKLLDHPGLHGHLLRDRNLLPILVSLSGAISC